MTNLEATILERNLDELLNELLFEHVPHVFGQSWEAYRSWRRSLASAINVDPSEIIVVGSAAVGYSLGPTKQLRAFDNQSDIDVAVVSDYFFSEAWHYLRSVDLTLDPLTPAQKAAVVDHQKRYVYWGCVATDRLLPIMPFAVPWLEARSSLAAMASTLGRDINFRIYKDFRALRGYQLLGLKKLRAVLLDPEGDLGAELP